MSEDPSIHCLKQSGMAAHAASCNSQLSGERLAAFDNYNDPFFTLYDDENERNDCQWYGLTSSSYSLLSARYLLCILKPWDSHVQAWLLKLHFWMKLYLSSFSTHPRFLFALTRCSKLIVEWGPDYPNSLCHYNFNIVWLCELAQVSEYPFNPCFLHSYV